MDTLPVDIQRILKENQELIASYFEKERELDNCKDKDSIESILRENNFYDQYADLRENVLMPMLEEENLRGWHYTRLTDNEVSDMCEYGIKLSSKDFMAKRLCTLKTKNILSSSEIDEILRYSVLNNAQQESGRKGRFWMVSKPTSTSDSGIQPLISNWGGEVVYFWLQGAELKQKLSTIGIPRIVEITVPIRLTNSSFQLSQCILNKYAGYCDAGAYDVCSTRDLDTSMIRGIHSEGESSFAELAKGAKKK